MGHVCLGSDVSALKIQGKAIGPERRAQTVLLGTPAHTAWLNAKVAHATRAVVTGSVMVASRAMAHVHAARIRPMGTGEERRAASATPTFSDQNVKARARGRTLATLVMGEESAAHRQAAAIVLPGTIRSRGALIVTLRTMGLTADRSALVMAVSRVAGMGLA